MYINGIPINVCHLGGLKGAIDLKQNVQDLPLYISKSIEGPIKFSSFVEALPVEENDFV